MSNTRLDPVHIIRSVYDEAAEAYKVKIQDTELAMELSATDGDSVTAHPVKLLASAIGVASPAADGTIIIAAVDCSSISAVHVSVNGTGTVVVEVSPADSGSYFYSIGGAGAIIPVCARRIRVTSTNAAGDVYLVGRS
jgi:hypothetical protein